MKTFALLSLAAVACAALSPADAADTNALRVTIHHAKKPTRAATKTAIATHHAPATASLNAKFAKFAHMKATPWEGEPEVKAAKCEDLCFLQGFYTFQQSRNCESRPTDLCMQYKLGKVAIEAVLVTAECECDDATEGSASDDNETVEVPTDA